MRSAVCAVLTTALLGTIGCGSDGAAATATSDPQSNLTECAEGLNGPTIAATTSIAFVLDSSVRELIGCGAVVTNTNQALRTRLFQELVAPSGSWMPAGLEYRDEGAYHATIETTSARADIAVSFYYDGPHGRELIRDNLFAPQAYLINPRLLGQNDQAELFLAYDAPGPWAKLLGFGNPPPNPIELGASTSSLTPDFSSLQIVTTVTMADVQGGASIIYTATSSKVSTEELFATGDLRFHIVTFNGKNQAVGQELTLSPGGWDIEMGRGNALSGFVDFSTSGGPFDFGGTLTYESSAYAQIALRCVSP
jgi:hypothetical protein